MFIKELNLKTNNFCLTLILGSIMFIFRNLFFENMFMTLYIFFTLYNSILIFQYFPNLTDRQAILYLQYIFYVHNHLKYYCVQII